MEEEEEEEDELEFLRSVVSAAAEEDGGGGGDELQLGTVPSLKPSLLGRVCFSRSLALTLRVRHSVCPPTFVQLFPSLPEMQSEEFRGGSRPLGITMRQGGPIL